MIRNKTIKFKMDKEEDRDLWEFLRNLEHGEFSEKTKEFWSDEMKETYKYKIEIGKNVSLEEVELLFDDIRKRMREDKQ